MKESQFKTMQEWFESINKELQWIKTTMATKADLEKFKEELDRLHGLIHVVHRRIDHHLTDDDSDKRLFRLALERLDDRVSAIESRPAS